MRNSDFINKNHSGFHLGGRVCVCVCVSGGGVGWVCINVSCSHAALALEVVFLLPSR